MKRFATGHRDANHGSVAGAFERAGCSVLELTAVGFGCPDIAIGVAGRTHLIEIKDGSKSPSRQRLRDSQEDFAERWRGGHVHVVKSATEALELVNLLRMTSRRP